MLIFWILSYSKNTFQYSNLLWVIVATRYQKLYLQTKCNPCPERCPSLSEIRSIFVKLQLFENLVIVKKPFWFFNSAYHSINEFVKFDADEFNNLLHTKATKSTTATKKGKYTISEFLSCCGIRIEIHGAIKRLGITRR